ncbi:MAG: tyrosine-type recombinase/integrase, partial [Terriglobia bacterium]
YHSGAHQDRPHPPQRRLSDVLHLEEDRVFGPYAFRHTFSSILHQAGTSLAVQKELLRHADIQTTMNIYTQAVSVDKREAVELVTKRLLNG